MEHEEDLEIDDPQEVILGGSDKEFDRHMEDREPRKLYSYMYQCITISCHVDMDHETCNSGYKSTRR